MEESAKHETLGLYRLGVVHKPKKGDLVVIVKALPDAMEEFKEGEFAHLTDFNNKYGWQANFHVPENGDKYPQETVFWLGKKTQFKVVKPATGKNPFPNLHAGDKIQITKNYYSDNLSVLNGDKATIKSYDSAVNAWVANFNLVSNKKVIGGGTWAVGNGWSQYSPKFKFCEAFDNPVVDLPPPDPDDPTSQLTGFPSMACPVCGSKEYKVIDDNNGGKFQCKCGAKFTSADIWNQNNPAAHVPPTKPKEVSFEAPTVNLEDMGEDNTFSAALGWALWKPGQIRPAQGGRRD